MVDLFSKTESGDELTDAQRKVNPKGVGLMQVEWDEIEEMAKSISKDMTGHALAKYLLREAVKLYKAGKIKAETQRQEVLKDNAPY